MLVTLVSFSAQMNNGLGARVFASILWEQN
jgi:hypothetical protein